MGNSDEDEPKEGTLLVKKDWLPWVGKLGDVGNVEDESEVPYWLKGFGRSFENNKDPGLGNPFCPILMVPVVVS